jgi:hypothetical protein
LPVGTSRPGCITEMKLGNKKSKKELTKKLGIILIEEKI